MVGSRAREDSLASVAAHERSRLSVVAARRAQRRRDHLGAPVGAHIVAEEAAAAVLCGRGGLLRLRDGSSYLGDVQALLQYDMALLVEAVLSRRRGRIAPSTVAEDSEDNWGPWTAMGRR